MSVFSHFPKSADGGLVNDAAVSEHASLLEKRVPAVSIFEPPPPRSGAAYHCPLRISTYCVRMLRCNQPGNRKLGLKATVSGLETLSHSEHVGSQASAGPNYPDRFVEANSLDSPMFGRMLERIRVAPRARTQGPTGCFNGGTHFSVRLDALRRVSRHFAPEAMTTGRARSGPCTADQLADVSRAGDLRKLT